MKAKIYLMLLPLTLLLGNCASTQNVVQYYANGLAKLDGVWVDTGFSRNRNDIVFDVTLERGIPSIKLLGQRVDYQSMNQQRDQVLIKFKDERGQLYYLLGQFNSKNEMRMAFTTDKVNDFLPNGQLGEKVYRLERIKKYRTSHNGFKKLSVHILMLVE